MPVADPIIGMNLSSSKTKLVQSWGLGHFGHLLVGLLACGSLFFGEKLPKDNTKNLATTPFLEKKGCEKKIAKMIITKW
jgi:hypothetical protein